MKLISCHIDAFGKLKNVDLSFDEKLNSICEENGYGKTTIAMFIKAMFYGLGVNKKKNAKELTDRTQYQPFGVNEGYGGTIVFSCEKGNFILRRVFKGTQTKDEFYLFNADNNLPSKLFSENIVEELFGAGKDTFDATIFFGQRHLESEVNDNIRATLSTGNLSDDDIGVLSKAVEKIKNKEREIKGILKNIDLEKDKRELNNLYLNENEQNKKIAKFKDDLLYYNDKAKRYQEELDKLDEKQKDYLNLEKQSDVLKLYIDEKQKEKNNFKTSKNEENFEKNMQKPQKNKLFLILSIISLIISLVGIGVYFATNLIYLIVAFGVFIALAVIFICLFFFKKSKIVEENNFNENDEISLKIKDIDNFISQKQKELLALNDKIVGLLGCSESEFARHYEEVVNNIQKCQEERVRTETSIKNFQENVASLQSRIQESDDKLQENQEIFEKNTQNLKILEKTEEYLLKASENLSNRYVKPVQDKFDEFYDKFFAKDGILVDSNLNTRLKQNMLEDGYLSAGILDLVHICKRFALVDLIYKKEKPFIILDDPFINLDDKNLKVAKDIVEELSNKYQIIFLTCHSSRRI